jgi:uroporphyrinogen-III synthase
MKVVITRPAEDAAVLARKLEAMGHEPVVVPLLAIAPRKDVVIADKSYQGICLTSANGASILAARPALAGLPVYTVGPQSAAAARALGFTHVEAHGGNVAGLCDFIVATLKPDDGPLLYVSGAATSGDLAGTLDKAGFPVDRVIAYDAVAQDVSELAATTRHAEAIMLYSPRSAELWVAQVEKHGLSTHISSRNHICLSAAVAQRLPPSWRRQVAARADEAAMLAALDQGPQAE